MYGQTKDHPAIVVGTDGSPTARAAVRCAALAAQRSGLPLHLVHAYSRVRTEQDRTERVHAPCDVQHRIGPREEAWALLDEEVAAVADLGVTVYEHAVRDSIPRALCRIGDAAAARLIVIGNQPTRGLFSPVKRLRHWAPCEVQVVDTDAFRGGRRDPRTLPVDEALEGFPRALVAA